MYPEWFSLILKTLKATYASKEFLPDKQTAEVWWKILGDLPEKDIEDAVMAYISTNHFPPAPADIRGYVNKMNQEEFLSNYEAWNLVMKAISNSIYNSEEEFNSLPPACRKAIGSSQNLRELAQMDLATVQSVEQSHFMRAYEAIVKREEEMIGLPEHLKERLCLTATTNTPAISVSDT